MSVSVSVSVSVSASVRECVCDDGGMSVRFDIISERDFHRPAEDFGRDVSGGRPGAFRTPLEALGF